MDQELRHRINAGRVALRAQVDFLHRQHGSVPSEWKEDDTRVTFADFAISERIQADLRRSFPQDDFGSEEGAPADEVRPFTARHAWILDPIDGTNNYALGLPSCAISLALLRDGWPVYGFVYDLGRARLIQGGPSVGVFDGCNRVAPGERALGRDGLVGIGFPVPGPVAERLPGLLAKVRVRSLGSTALHLAYVATGLFDGALETRGRVWDLAAGAALLAAVGRPLHPLGPPAPFPVREFRARSVPHPVVAGSRAFHEALAAVGVDVPPANVPSRGPGAPPVARPKAAARGAKG